MFTVGAQVQRDRVGRHLHAGRRALRRPGVLCFLKVLSDKCLSRPSGTGADKVKSTVVCVHQAR